MVGAQGWGGCAAKRTLRIRIPSQQPPHPPTVGIGATVVLKTEGQMIERRPNASRANRVEGFWMLFFFPIFFWLSKTKQPGGKLAISPSLANTHTSRQWEEMGKPTSGGTYNEGGRQRLRHPSYRTNKRMEGCACRGRRNKKLSTSLKRRCLLLRAASLKILSNKHNARPKIDSSTAKTWLKSFTIL